MKLKNDGVHPGSNGFTILLQAFQEVYDLAGAPLTITSLNDSKHGNNSQHYYDKALDARVRDPSTSKFLLDPNQAVADIKSRLNKHFYVVYETNPPHLHGEYDPKSAPGLR